MLLISTAANSQIISTECLFKASWHILECYSLPRLPHLHAFAFLWQSLKQLCIPSMEVMIFLYRTGNVQRYTKHCTSPRYTRNTLDSPILLGIHYGARWLDLNLVFLHFIFPENWASSEVENYSSAPEARRHDFFLCFGRSFQFKTTFKVVLPCLHFVYSAGVWGV